MLEVGIERVLEQIFGAVRRSEVLDSCTVLLCGTLKHIEGNNHEGIINY